jgi:hypothetical protein
MTPLEAEMLTPEWRPPGFYALRDVAADVRTQPFDLLAVLVLESGRTLSPKARYPRDPTTNAFAAGMTQITRPAAVEAGFIDRKLSADEQKIAFIPFAKWVLSLSVENQLRYVIGPQLQASPWYKTGKPFASAMQLYLTNLAAGKAGIAQEPESVIASKGEVVYDGNAGLDIVAPFGVLTIADLTAAIEHAKKDFVYQAAVMRYNDIVKT